MADAAITSSGAPTRARYGSMSRDRRWALRWSYFFLVLFAIFFLTPPIYMFITSIKTSQEISAEINPWWVFDPTLGNYIELLTQNIFLRFFLNSAIVAVCVVTITMLISVTAAFALARMKFWGSATLATGVFLTYLVPETLLFIPLFKMFAWVNETLGIQLMNNWWTLIILYPTLTVPFCTWIMIGYLRLDSQGARRGGPDRRRDLDPDAHQDLHPGGAARNHRRDHLLLHRVVGAVPLPAGLHHLDQRAGAAGGHRHHPDQG